MTLEAGGAAPKRWQLLLAYFLMYVVWGSSYLAIRYSVETIPPLLSGGIRFMTAGLVLLPLRLARTRDFPTARGWRLAFLTSLLPFSVTYGLITTAETVIPSSIAALLLAIEPLWFCLLGWLFFNGRRPAARHCIGIAAGFAGVCILIAGDPNADLSLRTGYTFWMLLVVAASVTWVLGAFFSKNPGIHGDPLTVSGMQMICGGAQMFALQLALAACTGEFPDAGGFSLRSGVALCYLIFFGSLAGYTSFVWLMRCQPANRVATHAFVNPVIAVIMGGLAGGEPIHANVIAAAALVVFSVIVMIWEK
ncbi:EamA family transporter [Cloacibacillus sp. An23]|uniref:EamA family transporter n=1 Tax=Cloacibacillus sp. An23 TaxID=1965591 RepID=UPI000B393BE9|nr:EamA family transporter [Cloacibacillus sp. An23]OUO93748.1 hypothetical protein B5F39_06085 [Cloacibacillus sp. An23]